MEIKIGDKILYIFPNPIVENQKSVVCIVESIDEFYVQLRTENNIKLKVTFKNFDYLQPITEEDYSEVI